MSEAPPPIHACLQAIARAAPHVGKDRLSAAGGGDQYRFRGIDDVTNALHDLFAEHGVIVLYTDEDVSWQDVPRGRAGNLWRHYLVRVRWTFIGPAGDSLSATNTGEGLDNQDKGLGKARSYALKDLLTRMLTLPTDDPHNDNEAVAVPERDLDAEAVAAGFASEAERAEVHRNARAWARDHLSDEQREPLRHLFDGRWPLTRPELDTWVAEATALLDNDEPVEVPVAQDNAAE